MERDWVRFSDGDKAVSPAIGVVLMVVIVVLLAAIMVTFMAEFDNNLHHSPPVGNFESDYLASGVGNDYHRPRVNISLQGGHGIEGDRITIKDESGNTIKWPAVYMGGESLEATEYVHLDGFDSDSVLDPICSKGDTYYIVYQGEDGQTFILEEWSAPSDPNLPASAPQDADGDGIPDWC